MRVLHLTRDFPPRSRGGLSSAVEGWVRAGARAGVESSVMSFDDYRPRRAQGDALPTREHAAVAVLRVRGPSPEDALLDFARDCAPERLHVHDGMLFGLARSLREALGVPIVVSVHVLQRQLLALRGQVEATASARAQDASVALADAVTAPSPSAQRQLRQSHPRLRAPLLLLPLVVEPATAMRPERPHPPLALFAGRFADVKGAPELLQAAELATAAHPELRFALAGGLPASPRAERRFLRQRLDALPAAVRARIDHLGWCDARALREAYRRAHVLVAPSWSETFGQCAFEALAHGTPVVAGRVGAYTDYLAHGRESLLVPPREPALLASAIVRLISDPALRLQLAGRAPHAAAPFAPDPIARRLREVYAAVR